MTGDTTQHLKDQARRFAVKRLQRAAQLMALHIKPQQKTSGRGQAHELIRFEWPGVLSVFDADTGQLLAISEPGRPDVLATDFKPLVSEQSE